MADPIGYMAVICPKIDFWQGYFINDGDDLREAAEKMRAVARTLSTQTGIEEKAVYLGGIVESAITGNMPLVGVTGLILSETETPFFVIEATVEGHGTYSKVTELNATSVDDARKQINNLPEVLAIKGRLLDKVGVRDGRGRKSSFH